PRELAVEVRVHVNDAGRDDEAVGVECFARGTVDLADLGHKAIGDRDVGRARRCAGAVDDRATADDEIVHCDYLSSRKKARTSSTSKSGSSRAAKWPPRSKRV